ncbi:MAG: hypothetical protein JEZ02_14580 [Desulfatibacillum sp.]|nr:hypothetical protein [Desulfatibacillum sp.]
MVYDPDIHRRRSIRLKAYDYSGAGTVFITICSQGKKCLFGHIANREMVLNESGQTVVHWWLQISEHFPFVFLDEFIVMPNHIHGVIHLKSSGRGEPALKAAHPKAFQRVSELGKIVAYFKYQSTKQINGARNNPGIKVWQRSYFEHVVRNENSLYRIRDYISNNPRQWEFDKENPRRSSREAQTLAILPQESWQV